MVPGAKVRPYEHLSQVAYDFGLQLNLYQLPEFSSQYIQPVQHRPLLMLTYPRYKDSTKHGGP